VYEFIRIQFVLGRLTAFDVLGMVPKGYITQEQAETIINGGAAADK
jgi:hypothetical protein